ncbi:hypothetical protein MUK42_07572 [Musa troglodytarum]|uniref:Uncharacterized protein n=1 Tax=Musa troglodytarum TaxID=320322 RepID=A0A9E7HVW9_9LILI|nr:hypothetical protein MUK42_07572 [Musa troglodytarum]
MGFMIVLPCDHGKQEAQRYHHQHHQLLGVSPSSSALFLPTPIMAFPPPPSSSSTSSFRLVTRHYTPISLVELVGEGSEA